MSEAKSRFKLESEFDEQTKVASFTLTIFGYD